MCSPESSQHIRGNVLIPAFWSPPPGRSSTITLDFNHSYNRDAPRLRRTWVVRGPPSLGGFSSKPPKPRAFFFLFHRATQLITTLMGSHALTKPIDVTMAGTRMQSMRIADALAHRRPAPLAFCKLPACCGKNSQDRWTNGY